MAGAGGRHWLIRFYRPAQVKDDHGTRVPGEPELIARAYARVTYGSGQERREAAQQQAEQTATFDCLWTDSKDVLVTDTLRFDGADWDIGNRALVGLNREIHFTATRTA